MKALVEVTQVVEVTLDETKFTPAFMADFQKAFFPFHEVRPIRVTVTDPILGTEIPGAVVREASDGHVIFRGDDGYAFVVAKAHLRIVADEPALASGGRT